MGQVPPIELRYRGWTNGLGLEMGSRIRFSSTPADHSPSRVAGRSYCPQRTEHRRDCYGRALNCRKRCSNLASKAGSNFHDEWELFYRNLNCFFANFDALLQVEHHGFFAGRFRINLPRPD